MHHGNNALGSLLQMQQHGRISALLGYWPEVRYLAETDGVDVSDLRFHPVQGMPLPARLRGLLEDEGKRAIEAINEVIRELRGELIQLYARWLDGPTREAYLQDAKGFSGRIEPPHLAQGRHLRKRDMTHILPAAGCPVAGLLVSAQGKFLATRYLWPTTVVITVANDGSHYGDDHATLPQRVKVELVASTPTRPARRRRWWSSP